MTGKGELTELLLAKELNLEKLTKYGRSKKLDLNNLFVFARAYLQVYPRCKTSPIDVASYSKYNYDIIDLLLQEGWDVNGTKGGCDSPLWTALLRGNITVAQLLIEKGADLNSCKHEGGSLMLAALSKCEEKDIETCIECVKLLLKAGISVNTSLEREVQNTALHFAAQCNEPMLVKFLIQNGANVNAKNTNGYTALHIASELNYHKIVKILMQNGVDLYVEDNIGSTALAIAVVSNSRQAVKTLVKGGFNVNISNNQGMTSALTLAACKVNLEMVKLLLDLGADPNLQLKLDSSPLLSVVVRDVFKNSPDDKKILQLRKDIVELLVENGHNLNNPNYAVNPLYVAVEEGYFDLAMLLVRLGANVNIGDFNNKRTLFHQVVVHNHDIIKLFLEYGGDYNFHNKMKQTPYNLAILQRVDLKFVKYFIKFGCPYNQNLNKLKNLTKMLNWGTVRLFAAEKQFFQGIKENNLNLVKAAVKNGAVVNGCSEEIKYPVHFLAFRGYDQLLLFILLKGVSPNMLNDKGESALYIAAKLGHYDCCCTLLRFGACYNYSCKAKFKNWVGSKNVLELLQNVHRMFALTSNGNNKVISEMENLINKDINEYLIYANAVNYRGDSLLSTAVRKNYTNIARELMNLRIKY